VRLYVACMPVIKKSRKRKLQPMHFWVSLFTELSAKLLILGNFTKFHAHSINSSQNQSYQSVPVSTSFPGPRREGGKMRDTANTIVPAILSYYGRACKQRIKVVVLPPQHVTISAWMHWNVKGSHTKIYV